MATITHKSVDQKITLKKALITKLVVQLSQVRADLKALQEQKKDLPAPEKKPVKKKAVPVPT